MSATDMLKKKMQQNIDSILGGEQSKGRIILGKICDYG